MSDEETAEEDELLHIHTSVKDTSQWTIEDKKKLLNTVVKMGVSSNTKFYKIVETSLKWENIKVNGKSAEECKSMYRKLIRRVRKYRTMQEIIADAIVSIDEHEELPSKLVKHPDMPKKHPGVPTKHPDMPKKHPGVPKKHPDMPKKPPASFGLFVMDMTKKFPEIKSTEKMQVFAKDWSKLTVKKKEAYREKYRRLMKIYEEKLNIFKQDHPDCPPPQVKSTTGPKPPLPSSLYVESRIKKTKSKHPELSDVEAVKKLKDKYKRLSVKKKLKWRQMAEMRRQTCQKTLQKHQTKNVNMAKRRTAGLLDDANDNMAKLSDTPQSNADSDGDINDPPRDNDDSHDDNNDPPRSNADSDGDINDPPRANADSHDDNNNPHLANADSDGDINVPPQSNADSDDDIDDLPQLNAYFHCDMDDLQPSSRTVLPDKRESELQLDREATQNKNKLDTISQNHIVPAQNNTPDKYAHLSVPTPENSNVEEHQDCPLPRVNYTARPKPPLPSRLYVESRIEKTKSKDPELSNAEAVKKLKDKYKTLSDKRKLKWIKRAMSRRHTYQDQLDSYLANNPTSTSKPAPFVLSMEEEIIWYSSKGKPVPAPPMYLSHFFHDTNREAVSHLNASDQDRELRSSYRKLTKEEITDLQEAFMKVVEEYVQKYTDYYNSLSEEDRSEEQAPEDALAHYNKILQQHQTKKKKKTKGRKAGLNDANNNKAKLSALPQLNADSYNDNDEPPLANANCDDDNDDPPLANADFHDDNDDPPLANADFDDDNYDPPLAYANFDDDNYDPPLAKADFHDDNDDPPLANSDDDIDDLPQLNAYFHCDMDDPQPSSRTVVPAKRKSELQPDREVTQKKNKHDSISQSPIVPAQNNTPDKDDHLSMSTPEKSNVQEHPDCSLPWEKSTAGPKPPLPSRLFVESRIEKTQSKHPEHVKHPDMPKKPPGTYSLFLMEMAKKYPKIKSTERMKRFAPDWRKLTEQEKEVYKNKHSRLKEKYEEELNIFKQEHPDYPLPGVKSTAGPKPPMPSRLFVESEIGETKSKHTEKHQAKKINKAKSRTAGLHDANNNKAKLSALPLSNADSHGDIDDLPELNADSHGDIDNLPELNADSGDDNDDPQPSSRTVVPSKRKSELQHDRVATQKKNKLDTISQNPIVPEKSNVQARTVRLRVLSPIPSTPSSGSLPKTLARELEIAKRTPGFSGRLQSD